jgi:hypothetical protein
MLNNDDRAAIEGLFDRLRNVERKASPRDPDAEALIREEIARQPGAPYYLAQTVLVQEHALSVAERRIQELEAALERGSRDEPFGGLFGRRSQLPGRRQTEERQQQQPGPWERQDRYGGGGFLAGAAQTALGVTGGILLGNAIGSMFGAGEASAAEAPDPAATETVEPESEAGSDDSGGDAGDFGDGGGFDTGGGFDFGGDF